MLGWGLLPDGTKVRRKSDGGSWGRLYIWLEEDKADIATRQPYFGVM
jgi:hypothetical protein